MIINIRKFADGKGKRKPEIQKLCEELEECGKRLMGYEDCFKIMGKDRNCYFQDHGKRKTRAYKEDIGKYYNMRYEVFEDEPFYICHDGRELRHIRAKAKSRTDIHRHMRYMDVKENENFRRFYYRSLEKIYTEFMLYAIGRNIKKYRRFLHDEIKKYEGKKEEKSA